MKIGTKSVLFGVHCFFLHPWFVALGWWKLYGFPWDPRLWVAFFVHDIGYWGQPNMDGAEGEMHPLRGANIMSDLFDGRSPFPPTRYWWAFTAFHSRYYARMFGCELSDLYYADKYAITLTPWWMWAFLSRLTGEDKEYQSAPKHLADVPGLAETKSRKEHILHIQKHFREVALAAPRAKASKEDHRTDKAGRRSGTSAQRDGDRRP